jgi:periplasmic divalent cation tolerance protein
MQSVYRWQGKVERADEYLLIVKTTAEQASRVETAFKQMHPYDLPEHLELSVEGGSEAYLGWIAGEVENEEAHPSNWPTARGHRARCSRLGR